MRGIIRLSMQTGRTRISAGCVCCAVRFPYFRIFPAAVFSRFFWTLKTFSRILEQAVADLRGQPGGERMKQRIQYSFTGEVQGVGFRYTAFHVASSLGLTGWVRNEYDGSVTMEVQGEKDALLTVVELIEKSRFISIDKVRSEELPLDMEEKSFQIRY